MAHNRQRNAKRHTDQLIVRTNRSRAAKPIPEGQQFQAEYDERYQDFGRGGENELHYENERRSNKPQQNSRSREQESRLPYGDESDMHIEGTVNPYRGFPRGIDRYDPRRRREDENPAYSRERNILTGEGYSDYDYDRDRYDEGVYARYNYPYPESFMEHYERAPLSNRFGIKDRYDAGSGIPWPASQINTGRHEGHNEESLDRHGRTDLYRSNYTRPVKKQKHRVKSYPTW